MSRGSGPPPPPRPQSVGLSDQKPCPLAALACIYYRLGVDHGRVLPVSTGELKLLFPIPACFLGGGGVLGLHLNRLSGFQSGVDCPE